MSQRFAPINEEWRWRQAVLDALDGVREAIERLTPQSVAQVTVPPTVVKPRRARRKKEVTDGSNLGSEANPTKRRRRNG